MVNINLKINSDLYVSGSENKKFVIKQGENKTTKINIEIPKDYVNFYKYVDFKLDRMTNNKTQILAGNPGDTKISFDIDYDLIVGQKLLFEVVFKSSLTDLNAIVGKTREVVVLYIEDSISATEDITTVHADVIVQLQTHIDNVETALNTHIDDENAHGLDEYMIKNIVGGENVIIDILPNKIIRISTSGGGSGGTMNHGDLLERNTPMQHNTDSIYDEVSGKTQTEINAEAIRLDPATSKINPIYLPIDGDTLTINSNGKLMVDTSFINFEDFSSATGEIKVNFLAQAGYNTIEIADVDLSSISYLTANLSIIIFHINDTYVKKTDLFTDFSIVNGVITRLTPNFATTFGNSTGNSIDFAQSVDIEGNKINYSLNIPDASEYKLSITYNIKYLEV